jgi:nicotinate-nucleotide pyrophosphorylase (carboxylating)
MIELPDTLKPYPWDKIIATNVSIALAEDLNNPNHDDLDASADITGLLIAEEQQIQAKLLLRESSVIAGMDWFTQAFQQIDDRVAIDWSVKEGDWVDANTTIAKITGAARSILTAERTAMNFLQTLCATATNTRYLAELIKHTSCKLLDTRKTLPGLRMAQKYAVVCGGGENHRIGLYDRFLIKENHIFSCGSIELAINNAKRIQQSQSIDAKIEIEVENMDELGQALHAGADIIMLDNFNPSLTLQAVEYKNQHNPSIKLEASGNLNADTIVSYAETGVDYVSIGAITKSIQAVDLSLRVIE